MSLPASTSPSAPACVSDLRRRLSSHLTPLGFDVHPFLVGWYNELVGSKFVLPFSGDTLAFVVISRPSMFEKTFLKYLMRELDQEHRATGDPLDKCMQETLRAAKEALLTDVARVEVLHDFELLPNRRPKILAQTAAHVAGAARLVRAEDVTDPRLLRGIRSPKVFPVCVHPDLGGWFAIRAVIIFPEVEAALLPRPPPVMPDLDQQKMATLLRLFNDSWRDWSYRDAVVATPSETYSPLQRQYFEQEPGQRWALVQRIKHASTE